MAKVNTNQIGSLIQGAAKGLSQTAETPNYAAVNTVPASVLNQAWSVMTPMERRNYINKFSALGYDVSTPAAQAQAWTNLTTEAATRYNNGAGIEQNLSALLDDMAKTDHVAAQSVAATNKQTYDSAAEKIKQYSALNDLGLPDSTVASYSTNVMNGTTSVDTVLATLKNQTKSKYPAWAEQIDQGMNMEDIASPYKQAMAQTLELSATDIGLGDPYIQRALSRTGEDGKPQYQSISDFQRVLRGTNQYWQTTQANNNVLDAAAALRQTFGR